MLECQRFVDSQIGGAKLAPPATKRSLAMKAYEWTGDSLGIREIGKPGPLQSVGRKNWFDGGG